MRRWGVAAGLVVLLAACSGTGTDTSTTLEEEGSSTTLSIPEDTERGIVTGVINGDTVQVMVGEERRVIRLAGIRAPHDDECYAAQASLAVSEVAAGRSVAVVGAAIDSDGTPLRYLIIDEAVPLLVNVVLVERGAAAALHGHELAGDFIRVNDLAYASGRGMWATFACGHPLQGVTPDRPQLRIDAVRTPSPPDSASVDIINASYTDIAVGNWTLRDATNTSRFTFPADTVLAPGDMVTVTMACNPSVDAGLTWCVDPNLWSGGGNTLIVEDSLGNVVDRRVHGTTPPP